MGADRRPEDMLCKRAGTGRWRVLGKVRLAGLGPQRCHIINHQFLTLFLLADMKTRS